MTTDWDVCIVTEETTLSEANDLYGIITVIWVLYTTYFMVLFNLVGFKSLIRSSSDCGRLFFFENPRRLNSVPLPLR